MSESTLESLRTRLSALDAEILSLIAERTQLSLDIGRAKRTLGRGTRDFQREKVVLEKARRRASEVGLAPDVAEQLMIRLIEESLSVQEQDRVAQAGEGDGRSALVIGGSGKMGAWFVTFLAAQGYHVVVADPTAPASDVEHIEDWTHSPLNHDVIVVATPLAHSNEVLLDLAQRRPNGLVFDIGSLKTPLRTGLEALRAAGVSVTSLHPMFGPGTSLLSGKHLLFVDVGDPKATDEARQLFAATMVEQADVDLDTHDRIIAFVLGLSHAVNLAFNEALTVSGEALPLLSQISSTTFANQLSVSAAVAAENPWLYYEIQALNDYGLSSLDALVSAVEKLRGLIAGKQQDDFVEMMLAGKAYVSSHLERSELP